MADLAARINAALPQTQCTRCGYPDCSRYAQAIATGQANINQCPPGGAEGVLRLAAITGQPVQALIPECGTEGPLRLAVIDENWCIGCTLCIDACPTDAIVGSHKRMHTVIELHCTGCELCLPVCPVDCISLETVNGERTGWDAWSSDQADRARARYGQRTARLAQRANTQPQHAISDAPSPVANSSRTTAAPSKEAVIAAALARSRSQR